MNEIGEKRRTLEFGSKPIGIDSMCGVLSVSCLFVFDDTKELRK